ncbi:MAG: enoyl-CoA hydratase/isomerase family protein [Thermoplasmatota archaeon]
MTGTDHASEREPVRYEVQGRVAEITLDRPEKLNAFDVATSRALADAARKAAVDDGARAVLLTGAGRAFCAGGDVAEMLANAQDGESYLYALTEHHHAAVEAFLSMPKPVIVAVNGVAAGGGFGLALVGDLRFCATDASFKPAYFGIGVVPDGGSTWLLPRLVGVSRAQEILFRDRSVAADEAVAIGMMHRAVPPAQLLDVAREEARACAARPAFALAGAKRLLASSLAQDWNAQLADERRWNARSGATADFREGVAAFKEKRKPKFG